MCNDYYCTQFDWYYQISDILYWSSEIYCVSFLQPSSAEDLSRVTSIPSFSDESLTGIPSKPSAEEDDALSSARPPLSTGKVLKRLNHQKAFNQIILRMHCLWYVQNSIFVVFSKDF